jgi:FKBP-type peptidyl-prolyl cis-trans isomerase (trigger factor)
MPTKISTENLIRHPNGTIDLKIHLPWLEIDQAFKKQLTQAAAEITIPGFRKGKAPKNLLDSQVDRSAAMSKAVSTLLPPAYTKLIDQHPLKPILYPQIKIDKGEEGHDWEFTATTCEAPNISLPDYKKELPLLKIKDAESKLASIITWLREHAHVTIPQPLVEEEANHRLASLAENISQIGLDMTKYLQTKKLSAQDLRAQTITTAQTDLEIEFILAQIQTDQKLETRAKTLEYLQSLLIQP